MAVSNPDTPQAAATRESLSQLLARILDQLSLSAWLPSAVLVATMVFVVQIRIKDGSVADALGAIGQFDLSDIVSIVLVVIVATVVTQAFEFEAIRVLEGYWSPTQPWRAMSDAACERQVRRRNRLSNRRTKTEQAAIAGARQRMLGSQIPQVLVNIVEADVLGLDIEASDDDRAAAIAIPWEEYANARLVRQLETLELLLRSFPTTDHRVLPTELGNTLRAFEDRATVASAGEIEGWVLRQFDHLPAGLRHEHDQHRTRLDLYCSLVFIALALGVSSIALLWTFGWRYWLVAALAAALTSAVCYRAAVASARAYGSVLETIGEVTSAS